MNRKEKAALCERIASWEFIQGGTSSEAVARSFCADDMRRLFGITDEDLAFDRAWQIAGIIGDQSEEFTDLVFDAVTGNLDATLGALERGNDALRAYVARFDSANENEDSNG